MAVDDCTCETCRLHDQLAVALKERDEYKRQRDLAVSVIERNSLQMDFAEATQLRETGT